MQEQTQNIQPTPPQARPQQLQALAEKPAQPPAQPKKERKHTIGAHEEESE